MKQSTCQWRSAAETAENVQDERCDQHDPDKRQRLLDSNAEYLLLILCATHKKCAIANFRCGRARWRWSHKDAANLILYGAPPFQGDCSR
jgi:hypothetical protein